MKSTNILKSAVLPVQMESFVDPKLMDYIVSVENNNETIIYTCSDIHMVKKVMDLTSRFTRNALIKRVIDNSKRHEISNKTCLELVNHMICLAMDSKEINIEDLNQVEMYLFSTINNDSIMTRLKVARKELDKIFNFNPVNLEDLENNKHLTIKEGKNRKVYLDFESKVLYKTLKTDLITIKSSIKDLLLNSIYASHSFYEGKYIGYIDVKVIELKKDGELVKVIKECIPPNSEPLSDDEKIPRSVINMIHNSGYEMIDIQPRNFVKVKNKNGFDYLPIDGKSLFPLNYPHLERFKELCGYENVIKICVDENK